MVFNRMAILPLFLVVSVCFVYGMEDDPISYESDWDQKSDAELANEINSEGISAFDVKMAYANANPQIKGLVKHLIDPTHYNDPSFRVALFYGEPGTGKTTMACAVGAYSGYDIRFTSPDDFQRGNRGEAAQNFKTMMKTIVASNAPTLLVIDEANGLWENTESKNHDNAETTKTVWKCLDKLNGNNKVFTILLANRIYGQPRQLKSRTIDHQYAFIMPISISDRYKSIKAIFDYNGIQLTDDAVTECKEVLKNNPRWTGRDYKGFIFRVKSHCKDSLNRSFALIDKDIIKAVSDARKRAEEDNQYYDQELSENDRQDLYHRQNQWTQILIQRLQKHPKFGLGTPGIDCETGNFIMDQNSTANQRRLGKENLNEDKMRKQYVFSVDE